MFSELLPGVKIRISSVVREIVGDKKYSNFELVRAIVFFIE